MNSTRKPLVSSGPMARRFEQSRPLSPLTTFRIGGPADYFLRVESRKDLQLAGHICRQEGLPLRVIGGGSNLLIADDGVRGVVADLGALKHVRDYGTTVCAEAGAKLASVIAHTTRMGLAGLDGLAGIPGTIGGAVAMNAGGRYAEIGQFVEWVTAMKPDGELVELSREDLKFSYRSSDLEGALVVEVYLRLGRGDPKELCANAARISREKMSVQPYDQHSAGCIFQNPKGAGKGAGQLIDLAGLKGERAGGAQISERHANFIVNLGGARASDVAALIERARLRVYENFGIELETEVKRWAA